MGGEITYVLRFDFHTSNNEMKYEALLARMHLAKEIGAEAVEAQSDSMLAMNQFNGFYKVWDGIM